MRIVSTALFCLMFALAGLPARADAQPAPASIIVIAEGMKGAEIAIPKGREVRIRAEGRDSLGNEVPIDPAHIKWRAPKGRSFSSRVEDGAVFVTAKRDAFDTDDGREPSGMVMAYYGPLTAGAVVSAVIDVEGTWQLFVSGDVIDLHLKQSGRWIKDDKGRMGTITGKRLVLHVRETINVLGIKIQKDLYPKITFTSREAGEGTVEVPFKTEALSVKKIE